MTTQDALDFFGSRKALAQALDIWPHSISRWGDRPPELQQYRIERVTKGKLKADQPYE
jgi:DNA-binding transcriptional regulator YdaS (Cro superfamily)